MISKVEEFRKINKNCNELNSIRKKNFDFFNENGFPTKKQESWKYTDLKTIIQKNLIKLEVQSDKKVLKYNNNLIVKNFEHNKIIFMNGNFIEADLKYEDKNKVNIENLQKIINNNESFEKLKKYFKDPKNSLESLNHALFNDGVILEINDDYLFKKPVIIYNFFDSSSNNKIINNKFFVSLGKNSKLNLVEYYHSDNKIKYFYNAAHNYYIGKNSILKKFTINSNLDNSFNYHLSNIKSLSNSIYENFLLSSGSKFLKNEIYCDLLESFSSCFINGLMLLNKDQHHELKTNINHLYNNCKSSQLVKSALLEDSKGTFQGKIYVDKDAQKTNGYQLSKALLLSKSSEFNSKPELEIYADDVKCSHGSTTSNVNEDSIYYLMSRGLTSEQSKKMLVDGFLNEAIETITEKDIKKLVVSFFQERVEKVKINEN